MKHTATRFIAAALLLSVSVAALAQTMPTQPTRGKIAEITLTPYQALSTDVLKDEDKPLSWVLYQYQSYFVPRGPNVTHFKGWVKVGAGWGFTFIKKTTTGAIGHLYVPSDAGAGDYRLYARDPSTSTLSHYGRAYTQGAGG